MMNILKENGEKLMRDGSEFSHPILYREIVDLHDKLVEMEIPYSFDKISDGFQINFYGADHQHVLMDIVQFRDSYGGLKVFSRLRYLRMIMRMMMVFEVILLSMNVWS